jgi:uncharacterized protein YkwD
MGMRISLAIVAALVLLVLPAAAHSASDSPASGSSALERGILDELNAIRHRHGLAPLVHSESLSTAARSHSAEMLRFGFFQHDSRDGTSFSQRIRRHYSPAGYQSWATGENLLWASLRTGPQRAITMWMASPPHRRNLLDSRWREVGIAAVQSASAPGAFGGRATTAITADFGVRR